MYALYIIRTCVECCQLHPELHNLSKKELEIKIDLINRKPQFKENNFLLNFFTVVKDTNQSMFDVLKLILVIKEYK